MTNREKQIMKLMLIYQYLYMTKQPTSIVSKAISTLKRSINKIKKYESDLFNKLHKEQMSIYKQAWQNTFGDDGKTLSMGTFIQVLYESCDKKVFNKWIGSKVMEKVIDSYFFAKTIEGKEYETEQTARNLAEEILNLLGEPVENKLKTKFTILAQNKIIEGVKNPYAYKEKTI